MKTFLDYGIHIPSDATGQYYTTCPICSETRRKKNAKCLSVNVEEGVWKCHHCGWSGSLKNGIEKRANNNWWKEKRFVKPKYEPQKEINPKMLKWFSNRGIDEVVVEGENISLQKIWMPQEEDWVNAIAFPYSKDGEVVNIKYRDFKKNMRQEKDAEKVIYRYDAIKDSEEIIITEGEMDCLSLIQAEMPNCCSVPDGAPSIDSKNYEQKFSFLESIKDILENANKIILCIDNDKPGIKLEEELARRIGKEKCWRVVYPDGCKDANDVLVKHGDYTLKKTIENSKPYPVDGIYGVRDFETGIRNLYDNGVPETYSTGWNNLDQFFTIRPGELTIVTGIPGHGKALALNTEIPTPKGFKTMADLKVGDKVFDENGKPCNIIRTTEVMYNRKCYSIDFGNETNVICDADHLWLTRDDKARRSELMAIRNNRVKSRQLKLRGNNQSHKRTFPSIKKTSEIAETVYVENGKRLNHAITKAKALKYGYKKLPLHPYLLGIWLGDGRVSMPAITIADEFIVDEIKRLGYDINKISGNYAYYIKNIVGLFRNMDLLNNKHIPENYLHSSINQRLQLIQGLMDSDGTVDKYGNCEFTNKNFKLATGVMELLRSLGITVKLTQGKAKLNGQSYGIKYRLLFSTNVKIFKLPRKRKKIKNRRHRFNHHFIKDCKPVKSVPVKCIEVDSPSKLFLCTKSCIPTHNSEFIDALFINFMMLHDWKVSVFSPENYPLEFHFVKLAEKLTNAPFFKGRTIRIQEDMLQDSIEKLHEHFHFILPSEEELTLEHILQKIRATVYRYGIRACIIDPWNEIEHCRPIGISETDYISQSLTKARRFARLHGINVFIIAHPAKLQRKKDGNGYPVPTPYDISGSAHWRNKADNCLTVFRDVKSDSGVVQIHVQKVKFKQVGKPGMVSMIWNKVTGRFKEGGIYEK